MDLKQTQPGDHFQDVKNLTQDFRSQQQFTNRIKEECAQRAVGLSKELSELGGGNHSVDKHPQNFAMAAEFYKDHFAKLKFNYLEQETKERFLKSLLKEPTVNVEQSDNWEIDRQNREEKQKLKTGKLETIALKREITTLGKTLHDSFNDLEKKMEKAGSVCAEIDEMEAELTKMSLEANKQSKLTVEEAKQIIDQQTRAFQDINNDMESRRDVISELSWKIENLEREIEQLESQKYTAEAYAADAIRMANKRDPTVEDLTKWQYLTKSVYRYISIVALCGNLFGLHDIKMLSESEIMAVFSVKAAITGDETKLYHLNVLLDPASGIVDDAESIDLECDIRDILDISRRLQREHSLPYLLQSVYARIRS